MPLESVPYPATGSTLDNRMRTGLSTQIIVRVNGEAVGAIQSFAPSQNRQIERVREVGTDGFIEIHPNAPTTIQIQVTRIVFDNLKLPPAFKRGFENINSQRLPFDIEVYDHTHVETIPPQVTVYRNCWFASYASTYTAGAYQISENATIECQYAENLLPVEKGRNERGLEPDMDINRWEARVDTGQRLGSMDTPDLIDEFFVNEFGSIPQPRLQASYSAPGAGSSRFAHGLSLGLG